MELFYFIFFMAVFGLISVLLLGPIPRKAGFSKWWAVILAVPFANIAAIWLFAYLPWPANSTPKIIFRRNKTLEFDTQLIAIALFAVREILFFIGGVAFILIPSIIVSVLLGFVDKSSLSNVTSLVNKIIPPALASFANEIIKDAGSIGLLIGCWTGVVLYYLWLFGVFPF